jgi:peptidoglycan/xylan/chitin deacetylase (PgdA/CDA1 family)
MVDERTGQDIFKTLKTEARRIARRAGKSAAAAAVNYSGVRTLLSALQRHRAGGRRVLVLSYHRVVGDLAAEPLRTLPTLNISQKTFRRQLEQLLETHDIVTIDEALAVLAGMERARRDVAVITFDDGYRDVFDWAFPAMRELNVTGVSYVPSSFVGTRKRLGHDRLWPVLQRMSAQAIDPSSLRLSAQDEKWLRAAYAGSVPPNKALERLIAVHATAALYELADALEERLGMGAAPVSEGQLTMSWGMLRELAAAGWEIGAHTADHTVLTNQPLDEARREIAECKAVLEQGVGRPVRHFAYCNGYYSEGIARALREQGFVSAVTTEDMPNLPGVDPYALKRKVLWERSSLGALGDYSPALTACQLDGVFAMFSLQKPVLGMRPTLEAGAAQPPETRAAHA